MNREINHKYLQLQATSLVAVNATIKLPSLNKRLISRKNSTQESVFGTEENEAQSIAHPYHTRA